MARELNFSSLDEKASKEDTRRWVSREPKDTVQMSVRMQSDIYDRFRAMCQDERRTNGEMLEELMKVYERLTGLANSERRTNLEMLNILMEGYEEQGETA